MAVAERQRPESEAVALDVVLGEKGVASNGDMMASNGNMMVFNHNSVESKDGTMETKDHTTTEQRTGAATEQTNAATQTALTQLQNELAATKERLQKADQERQMCLEKIAQLQADNQEMAEDLAAKVAVGTKGSSYM